MSYVDAMNDPAQISKDAQAQNDLRKRHKTTRAAQHKAAEDVQTKELADKSARKSEA